MGEAEQVTVAGRVGADRGLGKQATHHVDGGGGEGVAWVPTPITPSIAPANLLIAWLFSIAGLVVSAGGHRAADL
jgi:hypothetical protein